MQLFGKLRCQKIIWLNFIRHMHLHDVDYGDTEYGSTGKQINSKKKSSPSFGFGTQERDRYNKMYLSKQHAAKSISSLTSEADFMGETSGMVSDFFRMFFSTLISCFLPYIFSFF